ncbi:hypothetical protein L245_27980, partial [Salmonella enterica subsp. enterica serovar Worthington str. BCH-4719]
MKSNKQVTAATMKDVALKAKVSTATVSRALMNPDKVSQSTRSRVEQAALEVGYFPQSMGRNVKRNESRTILVIVPDICDPFFSEIIRGIEVTAAEQGYLVLMGAIANQHQIPLFCRGHFDTADNFTEEGIANIRDNHQNRT